MRLKKFLILSIPITYSKYHCLLVCLELLHYWVSPRTCPRSKAGPRWETFVFYLMFIWTTLSLGFYKSTFLWKKNEWNSCCNADKQLTLPVVLDISFNFRFSDFRDDGGGVLSSIYFRYTFIYMRKVILGFSLKTSNIIPI